MTPPSPHTSHPPEHEEHALLARQLAACLRQSEAQLPYVVTERLRASREQALAQHNRHATAPRPQSAAQAADAHLPLAGGPVLTLGTLGAFGGMNDLPTQPQRHTPGWLQRLLTALPLLALAAGLVIIGAQTDERATVGLADLDAELLTSELPPAAYTDPGFLQYLRTTGQTTSPLH